LEAVGTEGLIVDVQHLVKTYPGKPPVRAVNDISFQVERGEMFGFLGPNGAGKTTTIRCLIDVLRPNAGMITIFGLDARRDVKFVTPSPEESQRLLADRRIDAFLGFPPDPQELRAKKIGHVVLNSTQDRPWSQYFCCMVAANREFVRKNPIATKRALRALLKANEVCALDPEGAARRAVDRGFAARYEYTLETLKSIPYAKWREYNPEDTIRFYSLRLHEAGMIKSSPQKILAQGADWRFLDELRKEVKG